MHHPAIVSIFAVLLLLAPRAGAAQAGALTLEQALARARERGPALLAAAARLEEARGRQLGASVLFRENPQVDAAAGRRSSGDGDSFDGEVGIRQGLELGGGRGARIAAAEAGVARAGAARDDALRRLLREVAAHFYAALAADERVRLAQRAEEIAGDVAHVAERRHRAGDVPILDVNLSRTALARARSQRQSAEAESAFALGELRVLLDVEAAEPLAVRGELRELRSFELPALLAGARERADLRALEASVGAAEAELRLARGEAWPEVGIGARYERDDRADVVLGELDFTLPSFARGQGRRAEASARARRLRLELDAGRRAAHSEVQTAFDVYALRASAVAEIETSALPLLDENESLARRSYEAGQIGLADLLLVRREILETRDEYVERLLAAAVAAVELEASAGALR